MVFRQKFPWVVALAGESPRVDAVVPAKRREDGKGIEGCAEHGGREITWGEGVDGSWSGGVDSSGRVTVVVGVVVLMIVVGELYIGAGPLTPPYLTPPTEFSGTELKG